MKSKVITISIFTLFLSVSIQAQDFQFALKSGFHQDVFSITNNDKKLSTAIDFLSPTLDFSFKTIFPNNLEVGTGVGFQNYECNLRMKTSPWPKSYSKEIVYRSISVPLSLGYNLKLYAGLYLNFNSGLYFNFYFDHNNGVYETSMGEGSEEYRLEGYFNRGPKPSFNVSLSNTITLYYMTKSNVYVGLFGAYHAGLRNVFEASVFYQEGSMLKTSLHNITSKGSSWHFGVELGYRLKRKQ